MVMVPGAPMLDMVMVPGAPMLEMVMVPGAPMLEMVMVPGAPMLDMVMVPGAPMDLEPGLGVEGGLDVAACRRQRDGPRHRDMQPG